MKTYSERTQSVLAKVSVKKRQRRIISAAVSGCVVLALALVLFLPFSTTPPSVLAYRNNPYYPLIRQLNKVIFEKPNHKNNFELLTDSFGNLSGKLEVEEAPGEPGNAVPDNNGTGSPDSYQEVTDNQVEGVIEADLFKRSDKYLYYLRGGVLSVYTIAGDKSGLVGEFKPNFDTGLETEGDYKGLSYYTSEMYLSQDCRTLTLVAKGYRKDLGSCTVVLNLDVTDPAKITQKQSVLFAGSYLTSRMVDGALLLTYNYSFYKNQVDFGEPATFVPSYYAEGQRRCIGAENIICPGDVTDTRYTVVCKLGTDLELLDTAALLSFSQQIYVSDSTFYATHTYGQSYKDGEKTFQTVKTGITGLEYTGDTFVEKGSVTVNGTLKDQYSMDEYNGILRVVTTTETAELHEVTKGSVITGWVDEIQTNCDLYCIDLSDWSVRSAVVAFAPEGEEVTSARFDGDKAYVCTALVVQLTDPVFFFDLSDVDNISWTDTGTIDGFSSSMINFGDGFSLGVGFNNNREMKLEIYSRGASGVEPVCSYEYGCLFSQEYKAYYIDRENRLIGLAVNDWAGGMSDYLLLHFDGYQFREVLKTPLNAYNLSAVRATVIDGWLYILAESDFQVHWLW